MRNLLETKYGLIKISDKDILQFIQENLIDFFNFDLNIVSKEIISLPNSYLVVQFILGYKDNEKLETEKINIVSSAISKILHNNLGINIFAVQVGVKYIND